MSFIVLPGRGEVIVIGQNTLKKKLGIDVMAQLKASALKAQGRQEIAGMELTARSMGESNNGAVLRVAMSATAFASGGDLPGDVGDEVTLTLPSQRLIIFQNSEGEMRVVRACRRHLSITLLTMPPRRNVPSKMLRDIVFAPTLTCYVGSCWVTHPQEVCVGPASFTCKGGAGEAPT